MATVSITATNVIATPGRIAGAKVAAVAITAGQVLYQLANTTVGLADANGASPANSVIGIAVNGGGAGQSIQYVATDDSFTFGGTSTAGKTFWLGSTAGSIVDDIADLTSGCKVISLGNTLTTTTMRLAPVVGADIPA